MTNETWSAQCRQQDKDPKPSSEEVIVGQQLLPWDSRHVVKEPKFEADRHYYPQEADKPQIELPDRISNPAHEHPHDGQHHGNEGQCPDDMRCWFTQRWDKYTLSNGPQRHRTNKE